MDSLPRDELSADKAPECTKVSRVEGEIMLMHQDCLVCGSSATTLRVWVTRCVVKSESELTPGCV